MGSDVSLLKALQDFCFQQGFDKTFWIAYSGGLDSHVLLHALATLRQSMPLTLRAIHINHQLSFHAASWALHCQTICDALQMECHQRTINASAAVGESPEAIARERRYAVLADMLSATDVLCTAQHQDDQAETVLLQLLRGAGPKGLAAMPRIKSLGKGLHGRPLLNFTRAELQAYAEQHQLSWIEDESNANQDFSRNYLRHQVLPILKERWPTVSHTLARVALNCAEAQASLDEVTTEDLMTVQGAKPFSLSVTRLLQFNSNKQRHLLRLWLKQQGYPVPGSVILQQLQQDVLLARADKNPHMAWKDVTLRRYRDSLYLEPKLSKHDTKQIIAWNLSHDQALPGIGKVKAVSAIGNGLKADINAITIRFRQGGETCKLPGRDCTHSLKHLFQTWGVPSWQRDRIPLIFSGDKLAAVVGYAIAEEFAAHENEKSVHFILEGEQ